jgi:alkylation response protein AidB-like acyl-CoA dehydrogenase
VAALEDSLAYAQDRRTFGRPIWEHQLIGTYLADMATKLTTARQFADIGECLMAEPLVVALVPGVTLVSGSGEEIIELVSANIGVAEMPRRSRKDVVARPLRDAPNTGISLVWPTTTAHPL